MKRTRRDGTADTRYDPTFQPRPTCYRCIRPSSHCVCGLILPFEAHCNLLILQHPNERMKYYSTAKLVLGAVKNSKMLRGVEFEPESILRAVAGKKPYVLYPGKHAHDCSSVILDSNTTVITLDGTWDEAGKLLYRNPVLREFECLTFAAPLRSNYRIRKQPKDNYLSTVESIAHLLKLSAVAMERREMLASYESLLDGFARMVDQQLVHQPRRWEGEVTEA